MNKEQLVNQTYHLEEVVTESMTAPSAVEGTPNVFGTPSLVAFVEKTGFQLMAQAADEGEVSVGVSIETSHEAPTPVGMKVFCDVKVEKVNKAIVTLSFEVRDEAGVIGKGIHVRAFANKQKIEEKAKRRFEKVK